MDGRLNISAIVEPIRDFSLGKITRNKKKGTATVALNLPNPGEVTLFSKEAKAASAAGATAAVSVPAGEAKIKIKAKGERKRKLNERGKVKVDITLTYTPSGGDLPRDLQKRLALKKN